MRTHHYFDVVLSDKSYADFVERCTQRGVLPESAIRDFIVGEAYQVRADKRRNTKVAKRLALKEVPR